MKLKTKIIGILLIILSLYVGLSFAIQRFAVLPSFIALERMLAERDLYRSIEALRRELHHLDTVTHDWAAWDDIYRFVKERHVGFIETNLGPKTFFDNKFNLIYIYTPDGQLIWGETWDISSGQRIYLPEFPSEAIDKDHILLSNQNIESTISGIFMTGNNPLLVSSRPITASNHSGPIRGYLVMGRFLDDAYIRTLSEQTSLQQSYRPIHLKDAPKWTSGCLQATSLCHDNPVRFDGEDERVLNVSTVFSDIYGNAALQLQVVIPREIYAKGVVTLRFAMVLVCIAGGLVLICLWLLMNSNVLNPLIDLTHQVMEIRAPNNFRLQRSFSRRSDEIGNLYREFENMLVYLNHFHEGLVEANQRLHLEVKKRQQSESVRIAHETRLRELAAELLFTEERERRQLARDLHDRIGQALAHSQIKLGLLIQQNPNCCLIDNFIEIHDCIDQIIQDTRTLTFDVSPPVLYELGFEAAAEWLAEDTEKRYQIKVNIEKEGSGIPREEALTVFAFRALRELLLNVVKHADASTVKVRIRRTADQLQLSVMDDGVGFDSASIWPPGHGNCGFGLFSIQERTESLGGHFYIQSEPEKGTRAELVLPINESEATCR